MHTHQTRIYLAYFNVKSRSTKDKMKLLILHISSAEMLRSCDVISDYPGGSVTMLLRHHGRSPLI